MPLKDIEKRKKYQKQYAAQWYIKNKEKQKEKSSNYKDTNREWFNNYKKSCVCEICGYKGSDNPSAISFHHYKEDKKHKIGNMVSSGCSKETIMEEINKCKVLCENCHRIEHRKSSAIELYIELKTNATCSICGIKDWRCIEFHHIDGEDKLFDISSILNGEYNKKELIEEINKCVQVCANCHRRIHHEKIK